MPTTQIQQRQIANGAIADAQIAAGAAIVSSKLADGANFLKKDGTVTMTGGLNLGNNAITNLATPSSGTDGVNKNYVDTQISALNSLFDSKPSAKAAMTSNVALSNPTTAVFDGVTLSNGDRLLLLGQTAPAENGLYIFATSSTALVRDATMDVWAEVPGALIAVEAGGTSNKNTIWLSTAASTGTLNTTAITFIAINTTGLTSTNFVDEEVPSGLINGSNTTYTLANTPTAGTVKVYLNGQRLRAGGNDYTFSGTTITMVSAPLTGEYLVVDYRK